MPILRLFILITRMLFTRYVSICTQHCINTELFLLHRQGKAIKKKKGNTEIKQRDKKESRETENLAVRILLREPSHFYTCATFHDHKRQSPTSCTEMGRSPKCTTFHQF